MRSRYFALTGNSRKDSMMALIQQITLLLRISAAPNTVDEYAGAEAPVKIQTVCNMVEEWDNEIVVIGVRHKVVVESYAEEIRRRFPDRKLFVVTGSTTTLAGRRKLKRTLKESGNGDFCFVRNSASPPLSILSSSIRSSFLSCTTTMPG